MSRSFVLALLAAALLTVGCTRIRDHKGYVADEALVSSVSVGTDNKESVTSTLGRPTFVSQFDPNEWYYVSRETRQLAFTQPRATEQLVLRVRFDAAGNVSAVERTGLERIASIDPANDKTPTLGRDRGFFEELFGNIGSVRAPTVPGT